MRRPLAVRRALLLVRRHVDRAGIDALFPIGVRLRVHRAHIDRCPATTLGRKVGLGADGADVDLPLIVPPSMLTQTSLVRTQASAPTGADGTVTNRTRRQQPRISSSSNRLFCR